jgi:ketosteroid isomerase-like protein
MPASWSCVALILGASISLPLSLSAETKSNGPHHSGNLALAVSRYHRATVAKDISALSEIVTDDYMLVNSDATIQGKDSYLADFRVPGFKIEPYLMKRVFTRTHKDTALTGGAFQLEWTQEGRRYSRRLQAAHWWVRKNGRWRLAYTQLTRVPD